jgi:hypothetical protein
MQAQGEATGTSTTVLMCMIIIVPQGAFKDDSRGRNYRCARGTGIFALRIFAIDFSQILVRKSSISRSEKIYWRPAFQGKNLHGLICLPLKFLMKRSKKWKKDFTMMQG